MKKNKKENIIVNVENVKTRSGWNGVKPYTRIHTPKVVYTTLWLTMIPDRKLLVPRSAIRLA